MRAAVHHGPKRRQDRRGGRSTPRDAGVDNRVHERLSTDAAGAMACGLAELVSIDCAPERLALG